MTRLLLWIRAFVIGALVAAPWAIHNMPTATFCPLR